MPFLTLQPSVEALKENQHQGTSLLQKFYNKISLFRSRSTICPFYQNHASS